MVESNKRGARLIEIALKLGLRVYYDFNYCYIKLPASHIIAKFHLERTDDFMLSAEFIKHIKGEYFGEMLSCVKYLLSNKEQQDWPAGYTIVRRAFDYGSTGEYDDESGLIQSADTVMNRLYPKEEAIRILMRYRAYNSYVMHPVDPVQGVGMTLEEKYKFILNGGTL